jgi:hypothetical protein
VLSEQVVQNWLRSRALVSPFLRALDRARKMNRFLDWMVATGSLLSNPLTELRKQYGQRTTAPIVRALLNDDSRAADHHMIPGFCSHTANNLIEEDEVESGEVPGAMLMVGVVGSVST